MTKKKTSIALAVVYLFVGFSGFFQFPAPLFTDRSVYAADYSEEGPHLETTVCRGLPLIYRHCTKTTEMASGESS